MASSALIRKRPRQASPPFPAMNSGDSESGCGPLLPMTPPGLDGGETPPISEPATPSIDTALHVLSTERSALANVEQIYASDKSARDSMERAVLRISNTIRAGGKVILSGIGKSGLIARKVTASMNSMGIHSSFLHPTEALHGDVGIVRQNDSVLFITFSGKTPELMALVPHLPPTVGIIAITSHTDPSTYPLFAGAGRKGAILLPAPVHELEATSFGLPAPMTSTTVALAVSDGLVLATARKLYPTPASGPAELFRQFHPGGAIGATFTPPSATSPSSTNVATNNQPADQGANGSHSALGRTISDIATPMLAIQMAPDSTSSSASLSSHRVADILRTAVSSLHARGWVHVSPTRIISPRRLGILAERNDLDSQVDDLHNTPQIAVDRVNWVRIEKSTPLEDVKQALKPKNKASDFTHAEDTELKGSHNHDCNGNRKVPDGRIIAVVDDSGEILGVVEEEDIWCDGCQIPSQH